MAEKIDFEERAIELLKTKMISIEKTLKKYEGEKLSPKRASEKAEMKKRVAELKEVIAFEEQFRKERDEVEGELEKYQNAYHHIQDVADEEIKTTIQKRIHDLEITRRVIYGKTDDDVFENEFQKDVKELEAIDDAFRKNASKIEEIEDEIAGANALKEAIESYLQGLSGLQQEQKRAKRDVDLLKAELIAVEKEIAELEGRNDLSEAEKDRLQSLYEQKEAKNKELTEADSILKSSIQAIRDYTAEEGQPIRDHLRQIGIVDEENAVYINEEKIEAVKRYKQGIQTESLLMAESKDKLNHLKEKYKISDVSRFIYGNYAEALREHREEIKSRQREYHQMDSLPEAKSKNHTVKSEKKSKEKKGQTKPSPEPVIVSSKVQNIGIDHQDATKKDFSLIESSIEKSSEKKKEEIISLKGKRKIQNGYLYRISMDGDKPVKIKEDIQEKGYTQDIEAKVKEEFKKLKAEIQSKLTGKERKEAMKKYKLARRELRRKKSPVQKLELLLALKSSVNLDERMDVLKAVPHGNIYLFGESDLSTFFEDETKKGLFEREKRELKIKQEEIQKARSKQEKNRKSQETRRKNQERTVAIAKQMIEANNKHIWKRNDSFLEEWSI